MNKFSSRKNLFTLIEVVIALAILAISLTGILEMMTQSQKRLAKSYDKWQRMHVLSQAAEYYLLQGDDPPDIPEFIFPYLDYQVDVSVEDVPDLPEELTDLMGQVPLKCLTLQLRKLPENEIVDTLRIDRLSYDSEESSSP